MNDSSIGVISLAPDRTPTAGSGHIARCFALGAAWRRAGGDVVTADVGGLGSPWTERYRDAGIGEWTDAVSPPDWVVVDDYQADQGAQGRARPTGGRVAVIDDHGFLSPYDADLVIDQNVGATAPLDGTSGASGVRFAMLRPEFVTARDWAATDRVSEAPDRRRVLVSVGGAPTPATLRMVDVVGAQLTGAGCEVDVLRGATDVAGRMARADVAWAAAGSTSYELACVGTPAVLMAVASNQEPVGERMAAVGAARYLGRSEDVEASAAAAAVLDLLDDAAARASLSDAGRRLVDGRGADRVVVRLRASSIRLRDATPADSETLLVWANDPDVRRNSLSPETIAPEVHAMWFADRLADDGCTILIAADDDGPVGQIRFDRTALDAFDIDYSVVAARRGAGLGAVLLAAGRDELRRRSPKAVASGVVLAHNVASARSFDLAGFGEDVPGRWVTDD